jgi:hypothetical protein
MEKSVQRHDTAALPPPEETAPGTHWVGGWLDPRVGPDEME